MRKPHHRHPRAGLRQGGFTLIELMIAIAIVGILAAVAFPAYNNSVRKSRRADAKNAVLDAATRQERYFSVNNNYATTLAALGLPISGQVLSGGQAFYTLSLPQASPANNQAYTVLATPISSTDQANDSCYGYSVDQLGGQTNFNSAGTTISSSGCW